MSVLLALWFFQLTVASLPTYFEAQTGCPPSTNFGYFGEEVGSLYITMTEWAKMANGTSIDDKPYASAKSFHYNGNGLNHTITKGIKMRFRGRAAQEFPKKSFTIKFKNANISKLQLKAEAPDPTFIREHLMLDTYKAFGYCPQQKGFLRLWINGTYWGLYTVMEDMDDSFWQARDSSVGLLYKMNWIDLQYRGDPYISVLPDNPQRTYDKTIPTFSVISNLAKTLNNIVSMEQIEGILDVYSLMRSLAVEVATRDWDNYWLKANNYYLYYNFTSSKLIYANYDFDITFGSVPIGESQAPFFYNISGLYASDFERYYPRPLINQLLKFPKYSSYYYWCLSLVSKLLSSPEFTQHATGLQNKIRTFVDEGNKTFSIWPTGSFAASLTSPQIIPSRYMDGKLKVYGLFPFMQDWTGNMSRQLQTKPVYNIPRISKIYTTPGPRVRNSDPTFLYAHIEHEFNPERTRVDALLTVFELFDPIPWAKTVSHPMKHVASVGYTHIYVIDLASIGQWDNLAYAVRVFHPSHSPETVYPSDYPKTWNSVTRNG